MTAAAAGGGLIPARPLAAQAHALRAAAAFIEQAGIPGLSLTIDGTAITIQVPAPPARPGQPDSRGHAARRRRRRPATSAPAGWISAGGQIAGHQVPHLHRHQGHAMTRARPRHRPQRAGRCCGTEMPRMLDTPTPASPRPPPVVARTSSRPRARPRSPPGKPPPRPPDTPRPVPDSGTLEGFDFAVSSKVPAAQIRDLAALGWCTPGNRELRPDGYPRLRLLIVVFSQVMLLLRLMRRRYVVAGSPVQPRRVSSRRSCRFSP